MLQKHKKTSGTNAKEIRRLRFECRMVHRASTSTRIRCIYSLVMSSWFIHHKAPSRFGKLGSQQTFVLLCIHWTEETLVLQSLISDILIPPSRRDLQLFLGEPAASFGKNERQIIQGKRNTTKGQSLTLRRPSWRFFHYVFLNYLIVIGCYWPQMLPGDRIPYGAKT